MRDGREHARHDARSLGTLDTRWLLGTECDARANGSRPGSARLLLRYNCTGCLCVARRRSVVVVDWVFYLDPRPRDTTVVDGARASRLLQLQACTQVTDVDTGRGHIL